MFEEIKVELEKIQTEVKNNTTLKKLLKTGGLLLVIYIVYKLWREK